LGDVGEDSMEEVSGEVKGVETSREELSDSLPELEDRLLEEG
jgi:hypothetical protein